MDLGPGRRVVIYSRVSRDDTGIGRSNDRQEEDCLAFAKFRGWTVVSIERDVSVSAYSTKKRPGWERTLEMLRDGTADGVVAWKFDRITRNLADYIGILVPFRENKWGLATVDGEVDLTNETGVATATMMITFAQLEVERKAARQKRANAQRRADGLPWRSGWASFGYDIDKNVIPEQAEMIRVAAADVLQGHSLKGIARRWRESGVTTPRSSKGADGWTHNGVKSILLNPVNAGISTYQGKEIGKGAWEPILTEGTLRELQALLGDPSRRTRLTSGRTAENLLSGIARCTSCGHTVVAGTSNGVRVYKCSNPSGDHLTTPRDLADEFVLEALTANAVFASHSVLPEAAARAGQDVILAQMADLDRREEAITEQFSIDNIRVETWSAALESIRQQRSSLTTRLDEAQGDERTLIARAQARVQNFLSLPLGQKRSTIRAIAEVELHPRNRRRNVPIAEQVSVWAKDERRLSPLIAGEHPESTTRMRSIIESRKSQKVDGLSDT